jgi:hypothetical protein
MDWIKGKWGYRCWTLYVLKPSETIRTIWKHEFDIRSKSGFFLIFLPRIFTNFHEFSRFFLILEHVREFEEEKSESFITGKWRHELYTHTHDYTGISSAHSRINWAKIFISNFDEKYFKSKSFNIFSLRNIINQNFIMKIGSKIHEISGRKCDYNGHSLAQYTS